MNTTRTSTTTQTGTPRPVGRPNPYHQSVINVFGIAPLGYATPTATATLPYSDGHCAIKMLAMMLVYERPQIVALVKKYGADVSESSSDVAIEAAVIGLMRNEKFRKELKGLCRLHLKKYHSSYMHFTGREDFMNAGGYCFTGREDFMNFTGRDDFMNMCGYCFTGKEDFMNMTGKKYINADGEKQQSQVGKALSDFFNPERIGKAFDTGLDILNTQLKGKQDQKTAQQLLELERLKAQNAGNQPPVGGGGSEMSGTMKLVLGLALVGAVGFGIWYAMKKK